MSGQPSCGMCKHIRRERESWELPHIQWWECEARPGMANLPNFPFPVTKCKSFERKEEKKA